MSGNHLGVCPIEAIQQPHHEAEQRHGRYGDGKQEDRIGGLAAQQDGPIRVQYPDHWIEILGARIKQIHVKDFRKLTNGLGVMVGLLQGDVEWTKVVSSLREVNYTGYVTAELSPYKFNNDRLIFETAQAVDAILEN